MGYLPRPDTERMLRNSLAQLDSTVADVIEVNNEIDLLDIEIGSKQSLDDDLSAIAALSGTTGLLKKTAANTWTLDTSTYITGISGADVTTALGYTPYNSTNPSGYISGNQSITLSGDATGSGATAITVSINTFAGAGKGLVPASGGGSTNFLRADDTWSAPPGGSASTWGSITGTLSDQTDLNSALAGKQSTSTQLTNLLGVSYTSPGFVRQTGATTYTLDTTTYLTGTKVDSFNTRTGAVSLSSSDVTTALGFTPYNATNPSDYTSNTGTVTSVGLQSSGTYSAAITVGSTPVTGSGTITITPNLFGTSAAGIVPASGGGTSNYLRADGTWAAPAGGSSPSWHGVVYGAWADCDPQSLFNSAITSGTVAATPTNIGNTVARVAYFVPPANLTVARIRWLGVGAVTSVYKVAVYNADTLARVSADNTITTAANTWGSVSDSFSLTANQLYFIAVSVTTTGTTAGILCFSPTHAATTGRVAVLPKNFPGSLDIDSKHLKGAFAQFTVTAGALPATAGTIATQAAWTGGFPMFFLDSNSAA